MKQLLNSIDSKVITSVGGIILAAGLAYTLYSVLTNDLSHINQAILKQAEIQQDTNGVLRENAKAITGNTEVLRTLQQIIIQSRLPKYEEKISELRP